MKKSLKALVRRLHMELGGSKKAADTSGWSAADKSSSANIVKAEKAATDKAEGQASELRTSALAALKQEHVAGCLESEALLTVSKQAIRKVADEVEVLSSK